MVLVLRCAVRNAYILLMQRRYPISVITGPVLLLITRGEVCALVVWSCRLVVMFWISRPLAIKILFTPDLVFHTPESPGRLVHFD